MKLLRYWKSFRVVVIAILLSLIVGGLVTHNFSGVGIHSAIICMIAMMLFFSLMYYTASIIRWISELNHQLSGSMNPKSLWFYKILFYFGLLAYAMVLVGMIQALLMHEIDDILGMSVVLSMVSGLLLGCGNFLARETRSMDQQAVVSSPPAAPSSADDGH